MKNRVRIHFAQDPTKNNRQSGGRAHSLPVRSSAQSIMFPGPARQLRSGLPRPGPGAASSPDRQKKMVPSVWPASERPLSGALVWGHGRALPERVVTLPWGISISLPRGGKTEANHWQRSGFGKTQTDKMTGNLCTVANYWQKETAGGKIALTHNLYLTTSLNPDQSSSSYAAKRGENLNKVQTSLLTHINIMNRGICDVTVPVCGEGCNPGPGVSSYPSEQFLLVKRLDQRR